MKKISTIALTCLAGLLLALNFSPVQAQCTPDTSITTPGIYPDPMPDGCVNVPYNEVVQFVFPVDTTVSGFTVPFDSFQINSVTNIPAGLGYVCNTATCKFYPPAPGQPARGCATMSGTPTAPAGPGNTMSISVTAWATVPFVGPQMAMTTYDLDLDIYASSTAAFGYSAAAQTVSFTNSSAGATTYAWDFGDGNTSTMFSPTHTYAVPGNYIVCLIADNGNCADTTCQQVTTGCPAPTAGFNVSANLLNVSFTDQTLGSPSTWLWDLGDGNISTQQSPTHTYAAPGQYLVCLTVTDSCGTDSSCQNVTVVCPPPAAGFTVSQNFFDATFTDGSTANGTITYLWDFGDGNTSTMQNPTHTYTVNGNYTACLTVTDDCGSDSSCQVLTVFAIGVDEPALSELTAYPNPNAGTFTLQGNRLSDLPLQVRVSDMVGKVLYDAELPAGYGNFTQRIQLQDAAAGLYFLQVQAGDEARTLKIRVE